MTSTNLGSLHFSCSSMDNNEDQHKLRLALSEQEAYVKYYRQQYHQGCYHREHQMLHQEKAEGINSTPGKEGNGLKVIVCKKLENQPENSSVKWMSSKMRMMKKMRSSESTVKKFEDHKQASSSYETNNNSNSNTIRVCTDCNTTKTPLWRSGPKGPKSLCNACGIRQRKARRAMAAAAAAASGTVAEAAKSPSMKSKVQHKYKKSSEGIIMPFKKRFKVKAPQKEKNKFCFEDLKFNLSEHSAFQGVFYPQDEKEGAILLMALSHGLVQS